MYSLCIHTAYLTFIILNTAYIQCAYIYILCWKCCKKAWTSNIKNSKQVYKMSKFHSLKFLLVWVNVWQNKLKDTCITKSRKRNTSTFAFKKNNNQVHSSKPWSILQQLKIPEEYLLLYSLMNKESGIVWFSSETQKWWIKPPKISVPHGNIRDSEVSFRMDSLCRLTHHLSQNWSVSICYKAEWNVTQTNFSLRLNNYTQLYASYRKPIDDNLEVQS